jgi:signal transduction histidine kinase
VPRMADYGAIALVDADGALEWQYSAHRDPAKASLAEALRAYHPELRLDGNPMARTLRDGETVVIKVVDEAFTRTVARDERHRALLGELAATSVIYTRLATRNRVVGALLFTTTTDSDRRYTDRDVAIAREIGRRVAMAVDHALLYRQAEQAAAARDQLMAVVSHDLKNPLATIQLAATFLLEDIVPDDLANARTREQLRAIHRSTERMYRLITDLLNVGAIEAGQLAVTPAPVCVGALVADAVELLQPLALAKGITLVADVAPALPDVLVDRERLLQVFSNLGGNAVKFTPAKGRITIEAAPTESGVEFAVRDSGSGIVPDDLPHVFDRFWQSRKTARGGVGLGLAIAKGIVEAHGGTIRVVSSVGQGTCFRFSMPAAR